MTRLSLLRVLQGFVGRYALVLLGLLVGLVIGFLQEHERDSAVKLNFVYRAVGSAKPTSAVPSGSIRLGTSATRASPIAEGVKHQARD